MANFKIITNNPMVWEEYREFTEYTNTTAEGILVICRNAVHKGAVLINHPLSGSIQPNLCPYKSLVVSKEAYAQTNFQSLCLIEEALNRLNAGSSDIKDVVTADLHTLKDFQFIDLDLLNSALASLPTEYYK